MKLQRKNSAKQILNVFCLIITAIITQANASLEGLNANLIKYMKEHNLVQNFHGIDKGDPLPLCDVHTPKKPNFSVFIIARSSLNYQNIVWCMHMPNTKKWVTNTGKQITVKRGQTAQLYFVKEGFNFKKGVSDLDCAKMTFKAALNSHNNYELKPQKLSRIPTDEFFTYLKTHF